MKQRVKTKSVTILFLSFLAFGVHAQAEGEASVFMGRSFTGGLAFVNMSTFGGTVGAFAGPIGFELGLEYSPLGSLELGPIGLGASLLNVMGNGVVQVPLGRFRPYGTVGYGALVGRAGIDPLPIGVQGTVPALNFGGGAKIYFSDHVGFRVDYRRFLVQAQDGPELRIPFTDLDIDASPNLNRFMGGVTFRF